MYNYIVFFFKEVSPFMNDMYYTTESAAGLAFLFIYLLVVFVVLVLILAVYLLTAVPVFKLAQKQGHDRPWLAFIPFASTWLFAELGGKKPLFLLGDNVVIKDRFVSAIICMIAWYVFAPIAQLMTYAYLRDILYLYDEDHRKARNTAMILSLLDVFLTGGIARGVYLIMLLKKTPVAAAVDNPPIPEKAFSF